MVDSEMAPSLISDVTPFFQFAQPILPTFHYIFSVG